jgi:hypothetical protein
LPKLTVLIVVDQMRADYLQRFRPYFGEKGFRRLETEGRVFLQARYFHAATLTAPGHALIGSGLYGDRSGIIGNRWYSYAEGEDVYCVSSRSAGLGAGECPPVAAKAAPAGTTLRKSPCAFDGTTLAERVKEKYPEARVVGVSIKDRSAILLAGKKADAAYWVEEKADRTGELACSEYYPACRPDVLAYAAEEGFSERPSSPEAGVLFRRHPLWREWSCSLPPPCDKACPEDVPDAHALEGGLGKSFPHPVKDAATLLFTPYGNEFLEGLAERVVEAHDLGRNRRGAPDVLALGFSSIDYLGHLFGPDSCEAADAMKRMDATLARLLDFLIKRLGRENLLVVVTADHGVAPLPEVSLKMGVAAGRIELPAGVARETGKVGDLPALRQRMEFFLAGKLGEKIDAATPLSEALVTAYFEPSLYLNRNRIGPAHLALARSSLKEYLLRVEGIEAVYTAEEIEAGEAPEAVRLSFRSDRSGDLTIQLRPYWTASAPGGGADHGQAHDYDARVPLLFWGSRVTAGTEPRVVDMAQIAPTLARILELEGSRFSRPSPLSVGESP